MNFSVDFTENKINWWSKFCWFSSTAAVVINKRLLEIRFQGIGTKPKSKISFSLSYFCLLYLEFFEVGFNSRVAEGLKKNPSKTIPKLLKTLFFYNFNVFPVVFTDSSLLIQINYCSEHCVMNKVLLIFFLISKILLLF